jgi:hypothetical protein
VVVAELAVVTELVHRIEALHRDALDLPIGGVDELEELRERGTEGEAAAALVTDVTNAPKLPLDLLRVQIVGVAVVELDRGRLGGRHLHDRFVVDAFATAEAERASAADVLRSALAR